MNTKTLEATVRFLERVELTASEIPEFMEAMNDLTLELERSRHLPTSKTFAFHDYIDSLK